MRRQLLTLKCEDDRHQHTRPKLSKFDSEVSDLENTGTKMDDDDKISHLILTIPKKFNTVTTVLEQSDNLNIDVVKTKLLDVELTFSNNKMSQIPSENISFYVSQNTRPRSKCQKCGSVDHLLSNCPYNNGNEARTIGLTIVGLEEVPVPITVVVIPKMVGIDLTITFKVGLM